MPFKLNHDRRCHIPRQKHKVTNSAAYDAALRRRGSLTVWFSDAAIEGWRAEPRTTPGGQPSYSSLAILTALTLRAVFRMALRQTEGLIGFIIGLLGLALTVPDHSTLSRRAATLEVPRPQPRRDGEPLHLLVDITFDAGDLAAQERLQVHAGTERAAGSGQDAHTQARVAVELVYGLAYTKGNGAVHRVALLRPVDGHDDDAVLVLDQHLRFNARYAALNTGSAWENWMRTGSPMRSRSSDPASSRPRARSPSSKSTVTRV